MSEHIGKMAVIEWTDSSYNSGTNYLEDELLKFELSHLQTIGWIIDHEDSWLMYIEFNSKEKTYRHVINIPKLSIVKITYLRGR